MYAVCISAANFTLFNNKKDKLSYFGPNVIIFNFSINFTISKNKFFINIEIAK